MRINPENLFIETWGGKPGEEEILLMSNETIKDLAA